MGHSATFEAIILRTIDTAEADRLAILYTREGGRKMARAKSVRKANSRLGGLILPFKHLSIELHEGSSGNIITSATDRNTENIPPLSSEGFLHLQQGIEFFLGLTEDDEPIPGAFDLLLQFMILGGVSGSSILPAFQLRLLHLLGLLPDSIDDLRFAKLPENAKKFIEACTKISDLHLLRDLYPDGEALKTFLLTSSMDHLNRALKSTGMKF